MVRVKRKIRKPGNMFVIVVEECTGMTTITDVDPATNRIGYRSGVFLVTEDWLNKANFDKLLINVTLSHEGKEEDRVNFPDGTPYIDPFGFYVYSTSELASTIDGRRDTDLRIELRKELPRELAMQERHYDVGEIEISDTTVDEILRF